MKQKKVIFFDLNFKEKKKILNKTLIFKIKIIIKLFNN